MTKGKNYFMCEDLQIVIVIIMEWLIITFSDWALQWNEGKSDNIWTTIDIAKLKKKNKSFVTP